MKVMLIDDDESMQLLIQQIVARGGYDFCCAGDAESGMEMLREERPDFLILDVMLPDENGYELCRRIRGEGRRVPIMFLTAKGDIVDKSVGFNAGADDYLVKPFQSEELLLRIGAHLRRKVRDGRIEEKEAESYTVGDLKIVFNKYETYLRDKPVALSSREFEILALLASDPGAVFTREQILHELWKDDTGADPNSITVLVRKIREKIEDDPSKPRYLITVWRVGYKLAEHVARS